ncbi:fucolectin-6-like [Mytilus galloprovincialis]|uniref:fucolectin-6-like n=1 Tax=Mytilus galloprovincialis TaxID=29158 RepID=UPI003F7C57D8
METKVEKILEIVQDIQKKLFTGIPKEVAHRKSTYQSSTWRPQFPSSMAVDGSLQTIQHTDIQQNPYWVVDLGQMYSITSVEVYNEPNGNGERFRDVDILVGERHDNHMALCAHYVGPSHTGAHHVFDCNRVLQGKYVKITIKQRSYLHMAEVKVNALV